jgi:hypothetical protein
MLASSRRTSLTGRSISSSDSPVVCCDIGSKRRMRSISSPNRSMRSGSSAPGGRMSAMSPRKAYSPASITISAR